MIYSPGFELSLSLLMLLMLFSLFTLGWKITNNAEFSSYSWILLMSIFRTLLTSNLCHSFFFLCCEFETKESNKISYDLWTTEMAFRVNFRVIHKTILPPQKVKNCFSIDNATTPEILLEVVIATGNSPIIIKYMLLMFYECFRQVILLVFARHNSNLCAFSWLILYHEMATKPEVC